MELKQLGANQTEVKIGNNIVLFSYQTPVAFYSLENQQHYKTNRFYSVTTSKHINKWLGDAKDDAKEVDQSQIEYLTEEK